MHSVWARGNAIFFYMLSAMAAVAILCDLSTTVIERGKPITKIPDVKITSLKHKQGSYFTFEEAKVRFGLDYDFTRMFHWNVKQLFVYVLASYTSPTGVDNNVVIWDQIIPRIGRHDVHIDWQTPEYKLYDVLSELSEANLTLSVNWDVMPSVGLIHGHQGHSHTIQLPEVENPPKSKSSKRSRN
ncbi:Signal peptidase complex subunit 3 [Plasmodiophora brassicae]